MTAIMNESNICEMKTIYMINEETELTEDCEAAWIFEL